MCCGPGTLLLPTPEPSTRERCSPCIQDSSTAASAQNQQEACWLCYYRYHILIYPPPYHLALPFPPSKAGTWPHATFVNEQSWFSHKTINGAVSSLDINNTLRFKHVISTRILQGALIIWGKLSCGLPGGFKCHLWKKRVGGRVTGDDQSQKGNNWKLKIWKHISSHKQPKTKPQHSYSQEHTVSKGAVKAWCYYLQGMPLKLCLQT